MLRNVLWKVQQQERCHMQLATCHSGIGQLYKKAQQQKRTSIKARVIRDESNQKKKNKKKGAQHSDIDTAQTIDTDTFVIMHGAP